MHHLALANSLAQRAALNDARNGAEVEDASSRT